MNGSDNQLVGFVIEFHIFLMGQRIHTLLNSRISRLVIDLESWTQCDLGAAVFRGWAALCFKPSLDIKIGPD